MDVSTSLESIRADHGAVGLAAFSVIGDAAGSLHARGAAGERIHQSGSPLVLDDDSRHHIGSDTKSMTATLLAVLMERGLLPHDWGRTLSALLPDAAAGTVYADVTLRQLLGHQAGFPHDLPDFWSYNGSTPLAEQRAAATRAAFRTPPVATPGTVYSYSNLGFVVAGHIAERAANASWEVALERHLFRPLGVGLANATHEPCTGFTCAPDGDHDARGHDQQLVPCEPAESQIHCDNPPYFGPCGTFSGPLAAMRAYYAFHLRCHNGQDTSGLLSQESCVALHQPADANVTVGYPGSWYGFGWIITNRSWAGGSGLALTHLGSNGFQMYDVWLAPGINRGLVSYTNSARDSDAQVVDAAVGLLVGDGYESGVELHRAAGLI